LPTNNTAEHVHSPTNDSLSFAKHPSVKGGNRRGHESIAPAVDTHEVPSSHAHEEIGLCHFVTQVRRLFPIQN